MNLIDRDKVLKLIPSEEIGSRIAVANAPVVDAVPVSFIQQYIDRFYENEKHYYRSNDMVGYAFKAKRVLLQRLIEAWQKEQEKQNDS